MKHLNKNTKKARLFEYLYKTSSTVYLCDVYANWSQAKSKALYDCELIKRELDGWKNRIISYNTFQFTYAFLSKDEKTLYVITKENIYKIEL